MNNKNKKQHFNLVDKTEIAQLFKNFASRLIPIIINGQNTDNSDISEHYNIAEYIEEDFSIKIKPPEKGIFKKLSYDSKLINNLINFKIEHDKINYFSTSKLEFIEHKNEKYFKIKFDPNKIYKAQLRTAYRLNSNDYYPILFKLGDTSYNVIDVSCGGACLEFSINTPLSDDMVFENCELSLNKIIYKIKKVEVLKIWEDEESTTSSPWRAGLKFSTINQKIEEKLTLEINSEARAQEIRKMLSDRKK